MSGFLTGVLVDNEDGATYQGKVYDRFLKLRHASGHILSIFDPFGPISTNLRTGEVYEMIVVPLALSVRCAANPPHTLEPEDWQGRILHTRWKALTEQHYQAASAKLYEHEWVQVSTSFGEILGSLHRYCCSCTYGSCYERWLEWRL